MTENPLPPRTIQPESETAWQTDRIPAGCDQCEKVFLVPRTALEQRCPLCGRGQLQAQPVLMQKISPEFMLPFKVGQTQLQSVFNTFCEGIWLAPDGLNSANLLKNCRALFWPMYLVDSTVEGQWQAEMGFDYQVKSAKATYSQHGWENRDEVKTRTRYEKRLGSVSRRYENVAVPAIDSHKLRLSQLGQYDQGSVTPFESTDLGEALIELPNLDPSEAWQGAEEQFKQKAGQECMAAASAQHLRNFVLQAAYKDMNWTQFLLPMYASWYQDDEGQIHPILVNGQSGHINGLRMASQKKGKHLAGLLAIIAAAMLVMAVLIFVLGIALPPIQLLGVVLFLLGVLVGIGALVPLILPGQWNRREAERNGGTGYLGATK